MVAPDVVYYGYVGNFGLAEAGRANALALQWAGLRVARNEANGRGLANGMENYAPVVIHHWHPDSPAKKEKIFSDKIRPGKRVAFWVWECEHALNPYFHEYAEYFDEIWTASHYSARLFEPLGKPVRVFEHALRFHSGAPEGRGAKFRVLLSFDVWSRASRKNPLAAIQAFKKAFPLRSHGNCELTLKVNHLSQQDRNRLMDNADDPRVVIHDEFLSESELQKLFMRHHCVLSLHRSEGFGLNLARATAYGIPLVATNYGGNVEWMAPDFAVNWEPCEITEPDFYPLGGWWAEPDVEHAAKQLRAVYDDPARATAAAQKAAGAWDFSLDTLSRKFASVLEAPNFQMQPSSLQLA